MADSYHIIDGKVVPYSGGRKCNDTDAWRDATPLELQLQEQLAEYEHATAAQASEIEALRAQLDEQCRLHAIGMERELALITERDRLREKLGCLQQQYDERTACMIVHRGAALACSAAVRAAYSEEHERAERLAEALRAERRWWVDRKADAIREQVGGLTRGDPGAIACCDAAIQRIDAALREQEEGHEQ